MNNKQIKTLIFVLILIILGILIFFVYLFKENEEVIIDKPPATEEVVVVNVSKLGNHNIYFTIQDILKTFYLDINNKLYKEAMNVLTPNYIEHNNVNEYNIKDYINTYYDSVILLVEEIYFTDDDTIYFVKSKLHKEDFDAGISLKDYQDIYNIVYFSSNGLIYAIEPINEEDYLSNINKTSINKEDYSYVDDIEENNDNKLTIKNMESINIAMSYYNNFYNLWNINKEAAKALVDGELPNNFDMDLESDVDTYNYLENKKLIVLTDKLFGYVFTYDTVLDYTVWVMTREEFDNYNENAIDN